MVRMCVMLRMLRLHRYQKEETVDADPTLPCSLLSPLCSPPHTTSLHFSATDWCLPPGSRQRGTLRGLVQSGAGQTDPWVLLTPQR